MSVSRTARLATSSTTNNTTITGSVTAATGSSLIVFVSNATSRTVSSVTWTGGTFTQDGTLTNGTVIFDVWKAHNVTGGTNTLTVTLSGTSANKVLLVTELIPTLGALTSGTVATGTGTTNPAITSTSLTGTPNTGADVVFICGLIVARNNTDAAPTWGNPNNAGQKTGTTAQYIAEGFEINAVGVTQAASATMATAATYGMIMLTYLEPATGGAPVVRTMAALGVG